jgi:fatty-acyl-CoA synthase
MFTVYGLAEATLAVTFPPLGRAPHWEHVHRERLATEGLAVPVPEDSPEARAVASVGSAVRGMEVRVAGAEPGAGTQALPDGQVGEVMIRGASVTSGYLTSDGAQDDAFTSDGWLRTGDLGYLRAGELYVTGRLKEMIVVRGHNFYPHDVEELVCRVTGVHKGRCVAYAELDSATPAGTSGLQGERIVLAVESELTGPERDALARELRELAVAGLGLDAIAVHVVPPRTLPRTSSGKFQRLAARKAVAAAATQ